MRRKPVPLCDGDMVIAPLHTSLVQRENIVDIDFGLTLEAGTQYLLTVRERGECLHRARGLEIGRAVLGGVTALDRCLLRSVLIDFFTCQRMPSPASRAPTR